MRPNPQFPTNLLTFTEEILNGKLHFLYRVLCISMFFPKISEELIFFKIYKEAEISLTGVSQNRCSEDFHKIYKKIPAIESF